MPASIDRISATLDDIIISATDDMFAEAMKVQIDIETYLKKLGELDEDSVRKIVFGDSTKMKTVFDSMKNKIGSILSTTINLSDSYGMMIERASEGGDTIAVWHTTSAKPCPDCAAREGQRRSMEEWMLIGKPRSGWSVCGGNCHCFLKTKLERTESHITKLRG